MDRRPLNVSLWDVENTDAAAVKVRDMRVSKVTPADVEEFGRRYHYTGSAGSDFWRWGLWHGVTLHGVISYNLPTRDVCESVFGAEHFDKVWHMGRLMLSHDSPRNSESRLIAGSLKLIQRDHPDTWGVLTYAATDVGHLGYVYQATNALYTGTGGDPTYYTDELGVRHGTYLSGHVNAARAAALGWTRHKGGPKHRYLYVLGSRTQRQQRMALLRYPILPYPKITDAHCEDCYGRPQLCAECPCHQPLEEDET